MAVNRGIKQELLEIEAPEVYIPRKRKIKNERFTKNEFDQHLDVKSLSKARTRKRRQNKAEIDDEDAVQHVRTLAPRRPYQWKGRKTTLLPRPGVPVVFTPGQRTSVRAKRSYDEVYGDEDILDQYENREGEFAYGKRKPSVMMLDNHNPTPNQIPVTEQQVISSLKNSSYVAPGTGKLLPTVQVLVPKQEESSSFLSNESGDVKVEHRGRKMVAPDVAMDTVDIKLPVKRRREEDAVFDVAKKLKQELGVDAFQTYHSQPPPPPEKMIISHDTNIETAFKPPRPIAVARKGHKRAAPIVKMEDVEMEIPVLPSTSSRIIPKIKLHPSMHPRSSMSGRVTSTGSIIPNIRMHPSMAKIVTSRRRRTRRRNYRRSSAASRDLPRNSKGQFLPRTRYHPSIY